MTEPATVAPAPPIDQRDPAPDVAGDTRKWKLGAKIALANLGVALLVTATVFVLGGVDAEETYFRAITTIVMVSLPLFILVFICRPLHDAIGNRTTAWLLANRRYLGLCFAGWHLVHFPILGGLMVLLGPATFWEYFGEIAVPAGSVLLVITLMAATSTDGAVRFFGKRVWSAIHTLGLYTIWVWFTHVYTGRISSGEVHSYVYLGLLIAAVVFRWAMAAGRLWRKLRRSRSHRE